MKKLIEFVKGFTVTEWVVAAVLVVLAIVAVLGVTGKIGSAINEAKINKLEVEKQQAIKERDEARAHDLVLQGKIEAKDEVIKSLTSQIADNEVKVSNAHNETVSARTNYQKVRVDAPHFDSPDDVGRVRELGAKLHRMYPDSPQ
jgi:hypothetical protein